MTPVYPQFCNEVTLPTMLQRVPQFNVEKRNLDRGHVGESAREDGPSGEAGVYGSLKGAEAMNRADELDAGVPATACPRVTSIWIRTVQRHELDDERSRREGRELPSNFCKGESCAEGQMVRQRKRERTV